MKHTYVKCNACSYRVENYPEYNWVERPCLSCNNARVVINPEEILCNLCGECMCPLGTMNEQYPHGLYKSEITGGYDSYHLFDMTKYTFNFCEKCLRTLFNQCKIKPHVYDMIGVDIDSVPMTWEKDQEAYEYRLWIDNGGHHQAYLNRKCNFVKDCPNTAVYTQLISDEFTEGCCCEDHKDLFNHTNSKLTKFISQILKAFL